MARTLAVWRHRWESRRNIFRAQVPSSSAKLLRVRARQKIYGLGYSLLVFVYDKRDDPHTQTGPLEIKHTIFVERECTADYQVTVALRRMIENRANRDDILAYFEERFLPVNDIEAQALAEEVLCRPPDVGYLTISNALQWRLQ